MSGLEPLIPISLFLSVAAVMILRGPFGKALAGRLSGHRDEGEEGDRTRRLEQQLEDVHYRLQELEERIDFAERVVARGRSAPEIEGGR
jgi:hypothetical protein